MTGEVVQSITESTSERQLETTSNPSQPLDPLNVVFSLFLFLVAAVAEVGGGYLMWKGIRNKTLPYVFIPVGTAVLIVYGVIPTFQPMNDFGRIFAVYGGFFIVFSYLWGYCLDGMVVDTGDIVGSCVAIAGVLICWFWPRS